MTHTLEELTAAKGNLMWMKQLIEDRTETMDFCQEELDQAYDEIRTLLDEAISKMETTTEQSSEVGAKNAQTDAYNQGVYDAKKAISNKIKDMGLYFDRWECYSGEYASSIARESVDPDELGEIVTDVDVIPDTFDCVGAVDIEPKIEKVTALGQIKQEDTIIFVPRNKDEPMTSAVARIVKVSQQDGEEVIFDVKANKYFNVGMMLNGQSWVESCYIVRAPSHYTLTKREGA